MDTLVIVELEVADERYPRLAGRAILVEVHLLVFDGAPQTFGNHVVQCSPASIHTDAQPAVATSVVYCGLVKWLPHYSDLGCGLCQCVLDVQVTNGWAKVGSSYQLTT